MSLTALRAALLALALALPACVGADDENDSPAEAQPMGGAMMQPEMGGVMPEPAPEPTPGAVTHEVLVDALAVTLRGGVGEVMFEAPEDGLSLTVIVHGEADGWYGVDAWTDPTGLELVTADWVVDEGNERGCFSCPVFATQGAGASTIINPNRPESVVNAGLHTLAVVGFVDNFATDTANVTVIAKRGSAWPEAGVIDLHFYFTGAQDWSAETVPDDPYFAAVIARFNALYGAMGVQVGEMTFRDIDPALRTVSIDPENDTLGALVAESDPSLGHGAHVFFVEEILTGEADYPSIPGVAAGVPNPPYLTGTGASGIVISTKGPLEIPPGQRFLDPPAIGQTLCHEMGHLLGLFHTSEYDEVSHDQFEDTPENDNTYLMHADGTGPTISPAQANAIMANPLVRHPD